MKISTKGRYGLRAMIDLAVHADSTHVPLNHIAERQGISMIYLEQMASILRKAGLIQSVKGAQGGYVLAVRPADITAGTILRVLEGPLTVLPAIPAGAVVQESRIQRCLRENLWEQLDQCINDAVDDMTLEDLANHFRKSNGMETSMFYI